MEQQYHTANKRLAIAKRIAGSSKQPDELLKSKELLKSELEAVEEAQYAARAYTLMVQLFAKVIDRVSNAVAEREAQKSIRPEFVSSIGCQRPGYLGCFGGYVRLRAMLCVTVVFAVAAVKRRPRIVVSPSMQQSVCLDRVARMPPWHVWRPWGCEVQHNTSCRVLTVSQPTEKLSGHMLTTKRSSMILQM